MLLEAGYLIPHLCKTGQVAALMNEWQLGAQVGAEIVSNA